MDHEVQSVVIGAGVVGLAIAHALAREGREVLLLEANLRIGEETSARSNEVIHAGFLYPAGSLKARLCRPGRDLLYAYCRERGIPHQRFPKLMPAVREDELPLLETLMSQGRAAGVDDLELLSASEAARLEPGLVCQAAVLSPSTGIIDSHALMLALQADAEDAGATLSLGSRVIGGRITDPGFVIDVASSDGTATTIRCNALVNSAGLGAEAFARALAGFPQSRVPRIHFAKGQFFSLSGNPPYRHLVVPLGATLAEGGALTCDMGGQWKLGPDLSWVEARDYTLAPEMAPGFAAAAQRYWPTLDVARLSPGYAGIRPRTTRPGVPLGDWLVETPSDHGVPGLVHLYGLESPGLTSCLALADHVAGALSGTPHDAQHSMETSHA